MIVVTGAFGFIGSYLVGRLNELGLGNELILVDDFSRMDKEPNLVNKKWRQKVERDVFISWFQQHARDVSFVFHLGARTDTTETDTFLFERLNLQYSKDVWNVCSQNNIPLVYASSAATYGNGSLGFNDDETLIPKLQPLNPYGWSKQHFDLWALEQEMAPPKWAGLKFFNVYGPNEYHKGRMASVIMHSFNKIREQGKMSLFRSHRAGIEDGHQSRDFIYVKDIVNMCTGIMERNDIMNGIYNAGTGKARTFLDLTLNTFYAMGVKPNIEFIDTPLDIRDTYQYFTEANMEKWFAQFPYMTFTALEDGVDEYVKKYLSSNSYY